MLKLWEEWHLNGTHAGTPKQEEAVKKWMAKGNRYDYTNACTVLGHLDSNGEAIDPITSAGILTIVGKLKSAIKDHHSLIKLLDEWDINGDRNFWKLVPAELVAFVEPCLTKQQKNDKAYGSNKLHVGVDNMFQSKNIKKKATVLINKRIDEIKKELKGIALQSLRYDIHPDTGELYEYGHGWICKHLPEEFTINFNELLDNIEEEEEEKTDRKVLLDDIELFEDFEYPAAALALALNLELSINEIEDIEEEDDNRWACQGSEYFSGSEEDITERVKEYIEQSLWAFNASFLHSYSSISNTSTWLTIMEPIQQQCEGGNDAVKELVGWDDNADEITEDAIAADGYGHFLNSWDGTHDSIEISGETYIICQAS